MRTLVNPMAATIAALMLVGSGSVLAQTAPTPAIPQDQGTPADQRAAYALGNGDVIETAVIGRTDFTARVQIQEDGTVQLPFVGTVPAAGRTVLDLRDDLRSRLIRGGYLENPAVSVAVASYASRYVTVLGQVNQPGVVPIDRAYRLSEIVARAGGASNQAADSITLTRPDGTSHAASLRTIATAGPAQDPEVGSGDKVFVAPAAAFYIYGQVNAPGSYPIGGEMTVRMALARGGGLTALGSAKRVKLVRGGTEAKASLDDVIRPDDVLVIGERFF
ncbi:SLBB domain-containing protein [Sphingomonas jeddahensis]|uniref:Polysaccharide biosynthesis/export protein n=1 Tax=Sphingomonas jeddahensis TaxID=1915074 RepID=A0A1V2EUP4_9SPHN|nr:SLBB domain-containing protein [Sphingomonas jeddahensis]ONF96195.1 Polysaccharide biosynthesis/export protein [Sphingomonas jeddahensis]